MRQEGFRASDHYEKWDASSQATEDFNKARYDEWIRRQTEHGKDWHSNWNTFRKNRHRTQTDHERRAEREAKFGAYKPKEDSAFHEKNRAYHGSKAPRSTWEAFVKGEGMFKIKRDSHAAEFHGKDTQLNDEFEKAKSIFDSQTHESMNRKPIKIKDVKKMVDPKKVIASILFISGVKKTVDVLVR